MRNAQSSALTGFNRSRVRYPVEQKVVEGALSIPVVVVAPTDPVAEPEAIAAEPAPELAAPVADLVVPAASPEPVAVPPEPVKATLWDDYLSKPELTALAEGLGIEIPPKATKAVILALLNATK